VSREEDELDSLLGALETEPRASVSPGGARSEAGVAHVSCSMAQGATDPSLWPADTADPVRTLTTAGNQVWERTGSGRCVLADIERFVREGAVDSVVVVGHTDCAVVADAYEKYVAAGRTARTDDEPRIAPPVEVVAAAVEAGLVDETTDSRTARYRLVEWNVVRHVAFLTRELQASVTVAGYVHDEDAAYGSVPGQHYLVAVDGETDSERLRTRLPDGEPHTVANLLP
jgi:carbonic anhydrase